MAQEDVGQRLFDKLLKRFESLLDMGELSPTDARTLSQMLREAGYTFDEEKAESIGSKLTKQVDPEGLPGIRAVK